MRGVRVFVLVLLPFATPHAFCQSHVAQEEHALKSAGLPTDEQSLINFFRHRTLKDGNLEKLHELVRQLGSKIYKDRDRVVNDLIVRGPTALPFLKEALRHGDLEVVRRAETCVRTIEKNMGKDQPAAVARVLAYRR